MPVVYSAQIAHRQAISGPLPPPELLRQYEELKRRLRSAYPATDGTVVMPFRRTFVVATQARA